MADTVKSNGFYAWVLKHVHAPYARPFFFCLFALEAILLIPLDPVLAFFVTHRRGEAYRLAVLATVGSVIGAALGYLFGNVLWDAVGHHIIAWLVKQSTFDAFVAYYQEHFVPALFFGALFPFPFKVLTISAGFCKLPMATFCGMIGLARACRFFAITYISLEWGAVIHGFVTRNTRHLLFLLAISVSLAVLCYLAFAWYV